MSVSENLIHTVSGNVPIDGTSVETNTILARILELLEEYFSGLKDKEQAELEKTEPELPVESVSGNEIPDDEYRQSVMDSLAGINEYLEDSDHSVSDNSVSGNSVSSNLIDPEFQETLTVSLREISDNQKENHSLSTVSLCCFGIMLGLLVGFAFVRWFHHG